MSDPTISKDTPNVISSQESADGATHCDLPDGVMLDLFGQAVVHVNPSAARADKKGMQMSATYGRIGLGSSASAALQQSLANKLQVRLPLDGWMKPLMIWKRKRTPALRQYCQLALSVRLTGEIDCGLWPTATVCDSNRKPSVGNTAKNITLNHAALWQTPVADDAVNREKGKFNSRGEPKLSGQVALWATPNTMDGMPCRSPEAMERMMTDPKARKGRSSPSNLREQVNPSMWPTPNAQQQQGGGNCKASGSPGIYEGRSLQEKRCASPDMLGNGSNSNSTMDNTQCAGLQGFTGHGESCGGQNEDGSIAVPDTELEFIECPDGKARPVKPGICLLANGVSGRVAIRRTIQQDESEVTEEHWYNRIGVLKGFGNAIPPKLCAEFIKITKEIIDVTN